MPLNYVFYEHFVSYTTREKSTLKCLACGHCTIVMEHKFEGTQTDVNIIEHELNKQLQSR